MVREKVLRAIKDAEKAASETISNAKKEATSIVSQARQHASEILNTERSNSESSNQNLINKARESANSEAKSLYTGSSAPASLPKEAAQAGKWHGEECACIRQMASENAFL